MHTIILIVFLQRKLKQTTMYNNSYQQRKQYLTSVYEDTMQRINNNPTYRQATDNAIAGQEFIPHKDKIVLPEPASGKETEVRVSGLRTLEAARPYVMEGKCVAVLNFASATNPGGGVKKGSSAQEECLCRVSTLLPCLESEMPLRKFYNPHRESRNPLHNDDIIYTPDVLVIKDDDYRLLDEPFRVNVITCAAPNLREKTSNRFNSGEGESVRISDADLLELHLSRARKILATAVVNEAEVVILGAFGCGAFHNPPEVVAAAYKTVVDEFRGYFGTIEFAVYCRPGDSWNFEIFKRVVCV